MFQRAGEESALFRSQSVTSSDWGGRTGYSEWQECPGGGDLPTHNVSYAGVGVRVD